MKEGGRNEVIEKCADGISRRDAVLLALKMNGGTMSQEMWATSRNRLF